MTIQIGNIFILQETTKRCRNMIYDVLSTVLELKDNIKDD